MKDAKVLIIEDVITTGKSSLECSKLVDIAKANIVGYACIIDRSNGTSNIKNKIISQIELNIPTYTKDNLPKNLIRVYNRLRNVKEEMDKAWKICEPYMKKENKMILSQQGNNGNDRNGERFP